MDNFYSTAAAEVVAKYMNPSGEDRDLELDPSGDALHALRQDLLEARREASALKSELSAYRTQTLTAQSRALEAESNSHQLQKAVQTSAETIDNLREVVLSQEVAIATLQNEARMKALGEQALLQELHVAQECLRVSHAATLDQDKNRMQQVLRGSQYNAIPAELAYTPSTIPAWHTAQMPLFQSPPVSSAVASVSEVVTQVAEPSPSAAKERTDALLSHVRQLQHSLDASLQKRVELTSEVGSLALGFEDSLEQSHHVTLEAVAHKWQANLQASTLETEHEAYTDRVGTLEQKLIQMQSENEALKNDRENWLTPLIEQKVDSAVKSTLNSIMSPASVQNVRR